MVKHLFLTLIFSGLVFSQELSITALTEARNGSLNDQDPSAQGIYSQIDVAGRYRGFEAGIRLEGFESSKDIRSYTHVAQRYVQWSMGPVSARAGHYLATLGRGLLLRAYELPDVIFEHRQFRRRYAYYRDIDGIKVTGRWRRVQFTLLTGTVLDNTFPPELASIDRRSDQLTGGELRLRPVQGIALGGAYLHRDPEGLSQQDFVSVFTDLSLYHWLRSAGLTGLSLSIYAEHARRQSTTASFFTRSDRQPHATTVAVSGYWQRLGFSVEWKEYRDFENRVNLPPIGYREHTPYLLNRLSRELLTQNEDGIQAEVTWRPTRSLFIVANHSRADNPFDFRTFEFRDTYLELNWDVTESVALKGFVDQARDDQKSHDDRKTAGLSGDWGVGGLWALGFDVQYQRVERAFVLEGQTDFDNSFLSLTLSRATLGSISVAADRSTDRLDTDDPGTPEVMEASPKLWFHTTLTWQLHTSHQLSLFAGERRGGLICLSGSCFEVLPFSGIELRWTATL
jgi:hypothetical protein